MSRFLDVAWIVMRKDIMVEARSREIVYTTLFFAVSSVLVFAFALVREGEPMEGAAAGILWIAIAFAGTLALGRTFEREVGLLGASEEVDLERGALSMTNHRSEVVPHFGPGQLAVAV